MYHLGSQGNLGKPPGEKNQFLFSFFQRNGVGSIKYKGVGVKAIRKKSKQKLIFKLGSLPLSVKDSL